MDVNLLSSNLVLADKFALIGNYYQTTKDTYRAKTYLNASKIIADFPEEIITAKQLLHIKGIGPSVTKDIEEFLASGQITRLNELEAKLTERNKVIEYFMSFYGIGPVSANAFYDKGYRVIEDVWFKEPLTEAQKTGILWYKHLLKRIERKEMMVIEEELEKYLRPLELRWAIAGSYRRGESSSGDVDVLIESKQGITMDKILTTLRDILPADLATGATKYMGIIRLKGFNGHRIDIRLIKPEQYAYALLYFTGSQRFNILSRQRAIEMGLTLNEYGLYKNGVSLPADNEEDIFRHLGIKYLTPEERTKELGKIK